MSVSSLELQPMGLRRAITLGGSGEESVEGQHPSPRRSPLVRGDSERGSLGACQAGRQRLGPTLALVMDKERAGSFP